MRWAGLLALATFLAEPDASANETTPFTEEVTLDYRVPAGCPTERDFADIVMARTRRAKFVERGTTTPRHFVVDIERRGPAYHGRLVIHAAREVDSKTSNAARELTSAHCADLVRALALFTALAIDPEMSGEPGPSPPPSAPPSGQPSSTPNTPWSPAPSASSNDDVPSPPAPPPTPPQKAPAVHGERTRPRLEWHGAVGSGVLVASGVADAPMASAYPVVEMFSRGPLFSPSVRLGLVWANRGAETAGTAKVAVGLRALVVSGCVLRLGIESLGVGLRACAALEGGVLDIEPFALVGPRAFAKPWFAAGPLARIDVPLLPRLTLELEGGLAIPFHRVRGYVDPGPIVLGVGSIGARFGADVVLQAF